MHRSLRPRCERGAAAGRRSGFPARGLESCGHALATARAMVKHAGLEPREKLSGT
jgi:hypothetical protein